MGEKHTIHIRIRDLRREKALTQEELAEALGISRQSINAMEAGRCLPSLPVAMQIASFFSIPLAKLFAMAEEQNQTLHISNSAQRKEAPMAQLVPWSPLRDMREMLDELMDESAQWSTPAVTAPAVNIAQTEKEVLIEMRLPGFKREDLNLEVGEDFLTISGEMKGEHSGEEKQFFRREFAAQSFTRTMSLPALVQTDKAAAEMKHGILHIHLPKKVEEKPKTTRLEIKAE